MRSARTLSPLYLVRVRGGVRGGVRVRGRGRGRGRVRVRVRVRMLNRLAAVTVDHGDGAGELGAIVL